MSVRRPAPASLRATESARPCTACRPRPGCRRRHIAPRFREKVYREMAWRAGLILAQGGSVVADAVFDRPPNRERSRKTRASRGVPFAGIWLEADPTVLWHRVSKRTGGPSDATVDVLSRQLQIEHGDGDRVAAGSMLREGRRSRRRHTGCGQSPNSDRDATLLPPDRAFSSDPA